MADKPIGDEVVLQNLHSGNFSNIYANFLNHNPSVVKNNSPQNEVKTSIFYINDVHAQLPKVERLKTASDSFTRTYQNYPGIDSFKLSAGDIMMGKQEVKNNLIVEFLNSIGLDLSALGNHEFDAGTASLSKRIDKVNFKFLATNLEISDESELVPHKKTNKIVKSCIINKNGHQYGFIGASPVDLNERLSKKANAKGISVEDYDDTLEEIQEEIKHLKEKGVNKIIFLSHLGYDKEIQIAKKVDGIDVIIGGHSHDLHEGLVSGKNIVRSPGGEPVIITQAGKDGFNFGVLNVIFDSKGVIKSAANQVNDTNAYPKDPGFQAIEDKYLGKAKQIGVIKQLYKANINSNITENPVANLVTDGMRYKTGAQIAILNSESVRGELNTGVVTDRDIKELSPFNNKVCMAQLSEKEIIDALNVGAKSISQFPYKPGLVQVSGLKYTISGNNMVKDVFLTDLNGKIIDMFNHNSPSSSKKFTVAYDEFLLSGPEGFTMLKKPENQVKMYDFYKDESTVDYVKSFNNQQIELKNQNRILIEQNASLNPFIQQKQAAFM